MRLNDTAALTIIFAVILICLGCSERDINVVFGNPQNLATLRKASEAKAYRISAKDKEDRWGKATVDDYLTVSGPVAIPDAERVQLQEVLSDVNSFGWDYAKGCLPTPGVRLQFSDGEITIDVLLCFECDILGTFENGSLVGGEDFDEARPKILEIVKRLFPDDKIIQSLTASGK